ncbi:DNA polymerase LigD, ligase domain-containing protein [Rhodococcus opacus PD630]|uniref:ATP-dependent DNA ligase n=1 Tax=Rhodococcus opacus TaxID=37919 RepID=UPI00029CCEAB|nr:DNA ligase [Rhodococcus opacus]AHK35375.1 Putative DNA ligase-like protein [Rhodococcus opacus PD630]EHI41349.1 DNA polymerase LigD, ligase domain-containing protein [Rhodococcus opacus PD630]UDH01663.1 DNA ligase [Rhodococcus opacus PD630]
MRLIAPMLATPGEPPEDMDGWAAEMKYDGCRVLAAAGGGQRPVLWTRNLNVVTSSYPEVTEALAEVFGGHRRIVFDGEIVALSQGRPSFARLQRRMNTLRPTTTLRRQVPVTYLPFDVLTADGEDLMAAPYVDRRAALTDLGHDLRGAIQVLPHWEGIGSAVILDAARNSMMEGALFKRVSSLYTPGQRSRLWRKVLLRNRSSAVVVGWVPGGRAERNMVGALVLGAYDEAGVLRYVGQVGTGFSMAVRRQLKEKLALLERRTSPLGTDAAAAEEHGIVRWVEPVVVVDVAYREYLPGGLRHPSFKGQRGDLDPGSITRDSL